MKLDFDLKLLAGAETKAFLVELSKMTERLEKVASILRAPGEVAAVAAPAVEADEETEASDDDFCSEPEVNSDDGFGDEAAETEQSDDFEEAAPAPVAKKRGRPAKEEKPVAAPAVKAEKPAKAAKESKITIDDVNDACKAKLKSLIEKRGISGKDARDLVLKVLKKHFNTSSVSELDAKDYAKAVELMKG